MAELPLVSPLGSLASKRRWDQLGAFSIGKQKSRRFDAASYLGEKPFEKDVAEPLNVVEPTVNKFVK